MQHTSSFSYRCWLPRHCDSMHSLVARLMVRLCYCTPKSALRTSWLLLVSCTLFFHASQGSVHYYSHKGFQESGNGFLFHGGSEGMRAATAEGALGGIANGRSYIRFDAIKFYRTQEASSRHSGDASSTGLIQAVVFEVSDRSRVGSGRDTFCCTPSIVDEEGCKQGEVIVRPSRKDPNWPVVISVHFKGDSLDVPLPSEVVNITETGLYNVLFVFCDPQLKGVVMDGATVWKNPSGYLPGSMAPLVAFYGYLSLAYILLGIVWFSQSMKYWKDMVSLQNYLTIIIALGLLEMTLQYFEYVNFNATGNRPVGITLWAVTFGDLKKALCRVLMLAVSLGYGVVRPTVGIHAFKVLILGGVYFLAVEILDIIENVGAINDFSGSVKALLVLPVAVLDAVFIIWIFVNLSKILEKLQAKRLVAKLDIYRKLTTTLSLSVVIAATWIGYEFYFKTTDPFGERWQKAWIIDAFWSVMAFTLLCIICALWAPSHDTSGYAYLEDEDTKYFDEEGVPLSTSNVLLDVERSTLKCEKRDDVEKNTLKRDKGEKKQVKSTGFTWDDEPDENKRE